MLDRSALDSGKAGDVHQAGHIAADQDVGIAFQNVIQLQGSHASGDVGEGDGKSASKATALLILAEGDDFCIFDRGEQCGDCRSTIRAAAVAGAVKGDAGRFVESALPAFHPEAIGDEVTHFPRPACHGIHGGVRAIFELEWISVEVHRGTRAAGNDHRQFTGKDTSGVAGDLPRCSPVAGVEGWLPTAGLVIWEENFDSQVLKNFYGRACDVVIEGITETSAHEQDFLVSRAGLGFGSHWFQR